MKLSMLATGIVRPHDPLVSGSVVEWDSGKATTLNDGPSREALNAFVRLGHADIVEVRQFLTRWGVPSPQTPRRDVLNWNFDDHAALEPAPRERLHRFQIDWYAADANKILSSVADRTSQLPPDPQFPPSSPGNSLETYIEGWLAGTGARVRLSEAGKLLLVADGLLGQIALTLLQVLDTPERVGICIKCGNPFVAARRVDTRARQACDLHARLMTYSVSKQKQRKGPRLKPDQE